jgi:hypothetical protein
MNCGVILCVSTRPSPPPLAKVASRTRAVKQLRDGPHEIVLRDRFERVLHGRVCLEGDESAYRTKCCPLALVLGPLPVLVCRLFHFVLPLCCLVVTDRRRSAATNNASRGLCSVSSLIASPMLVGHNVRPSELLCRLARLAVKKFGASAFRPSSEADTSQTQKT